MVRILILLGMVCSIFSPLASGADEMLVTKATVVTVPGHVDLVDLEMNVITIEGKDYSIHEGVAVTRKGTRFNIRNVSEGTFVIATVKDDAVVGLTVMPAGQGF